jgi:small-conductance mechanosensitive channel
MTIRRRHVLAAIQGCLLAFALTVTALFGAGALAADRHPAAWVELDGQRVMEVRVAAGAQEPSDVVRRINRALLRIAEDSSITPQQVGVEEQPPYWMVTVREAKGRSVAQLAVDERAARSFGITQRALAERYRDQIQTAIRRYRTQHSLEAWIRGAVLALLVLAIYLGWLLWQRRVHRRLHQRVSHRCPGLRIGSARLLEPAQLRPFLLLALSLLNWSLLLLISYLLVPLLLSLFPPTQGLAAGLRGQILAALQALGAAVVAVLPNLTAIALILLITVGLVRASNAWFSALDQERLRLPGFYPEWGRPSGRIASVLIVMAGLVAAYPYIPGAGNRTFQGAGLFVGLLAALGSSAVATNVISGLMLIYTRGFREGDRVEINGVVGVVQDRALLVTRICTPRNELVSIPNATVISASIVNYSLAAREINQPVAIATTITIGYDVPWRQVHALLLEAARSVEGISTTPEPFVLQTSLNDFHISYEINASVHDVNRYRETLSQLLAAIQDQFAEANVEILSPGYHAIRNGNRSTVPGKTGEGFSGSDTQKP